MKFIAALSALLSTAAAMDLKANSPLGMNLISKARNLEQNGDNGEFENVWVADYSIKFQGCHHIKQWNDEADEENDVRIETKRLVRFRLCPTESCSASKAAGCTNGYGDYVIDMDTFMESYAEVKNMEIEYECQKHMNTNCNCEDDGNQGDDFNRDYCEYDCYNDFGMSECIENNPYQDDEVEEFEVERYMMCEQLEINNNNRRKLNQQVEYFVGPYCANQGGAIHLGLFTDDTCSTFADTEFEYLAGFELPYSSESIIGEECLSCKEKDYEQEMENAYQQAQGNYNDEQDADEVRENCEQLYLGAGKCEANLPSGTVYYKNNNACNYMEGIRIVRQDGIIDTATSRPSAVATAFIVIFAMAFAAMAFYVWYLRTRLGVKQNTLL